MKGNSMRKSAGARTSVHRRSVVPSRRLTDAELDAMQQYGEAFAPGDEMATRILHAVTEIRDTRRAMKFRDDAKILPTLFHDVLERAVQTDTQRRVRWLQAIVAEEYGMSVETMMSASRKHDVAHPRQVAMRLCRDMLSLKLQAVASAFDCHHTTVLHALQKDDAPFVAEVARVREVAEVELDHRVEQHRHVLGLPSRVAARKEQEANPCQAS